MDVLESRLLVRPKDSPSGVSCAGREAWKNPENTVLLYMLCLRVYVRGGCDTGGVSDGSRLAIYQTLFSECTSSACIRHALGLFSGFLARLPILPMLYFLAFICIFLSFLLLFYFPFFLPFLPGFCFYALVGAL